MTPRKYTPWTDAPPDDQEDPQAPPMDGAGLYVWDCLEAMREALDALWDEYRDDPLLRDRVRDQTLLGLDSGIERCVRALDAGDLLELDEGPLEFTLRRACERKLEETIEKRRNREKEDGTGGNISP